MSPFDPEPRTLCPDPQLGTRQGWDWCEDCCGIQPPGHIHSDELVGIRTPVGDVMTLPGSPVAWLGERLETKNRWLAEAEGELDFYESLLCALAFDHAAAVRALGCAPVGVPPEFSACVFCNSTCSTPEPR